MLIGCQTTNNNTDIKNIIKDLRDLAEVGTVYAITENPVWRNNISLVKDQLLAASFNENEPITFDKLLSILQGLPTKELKSPEALLAITGTKIILRRVGSDVDLGNLKNYTLIAKAIAEGMTAGLHVP